VHEAAVIGLPDDDLGERIVAYVVTDVDVATLEPTPPPYSRRTSDTRDPHRRRAAAQRDGESAEDRAAR